jgi:hypothetical protein
MKAGYVGVYVWGVCVRCIWTELGLALIVSIGARVAEVHLLHARHACVCRQRCTVASYLRRSICGHIYYLPPILTEVSEASIEQAPHTRSSHLYTTLGSHVARVAAISLGPVAPSSLARMHAQASLACAVCMALAHILVCCAGSSLI